ncbi:MAG: hypothetical protein RL499_98 [Actinomycetota bacterium]
MGEPVDDTVIRPRAPQPRDQSRADDLDDTVIRLVEPPAPRRADALPSDPVPVAAPAPVVQAAPPGDREPEQSAAAAWGMRVRGTTVVVPLDVPAVVGRRPGVARVGEHPAPRRVVIPADRADVSARHARVELVGESLVVTDLGSTNGVVVHWSSGASVRLRSRESCAVLSDAIILLGEGVELEFVALSASSTSSLSELS